MDNIKMNRQLGTKWFTFFTKVRPWFGCLSGFSVIADFMQYQEIYTSHWWLMVYLFIALFQCVLEIAVFVKSFGDYEKFVRFVKGVLIFEVISITYSSVMKWYLNEGSLIASIIIFILMYFVWYRLNIKYFKKRINVAANTFLTDDVNSLAECSYCGYKDKYYFDVCPRCGQNANPYVSIDVNAEPAIVANRAQYCRKCGEKLIENSIYCSSCGTKIAD